MPKIPRPGMIGRYVEFPVDLDEQFRAFANDRSSTFVAEVRLAMRRHMAYPDTPAPLPKKKVRKKSG